MSKKVDIYSTLGRLYLKYISLHFNFQILLIKNGFLINNWTPFY
jgi:hypothetical protein